MEQESIMSEIVKNNLKSLRDRSRLTLEEVSILTGYDTTTISKHENFQRALTDEAIVKYSRLYKCMTHELFVLG